MGSNPCLGTATQSDLKTGTFLNTPTCRYLPENEGTRLELMSKLGGTGGVISKSHTRNCPMLDAACGMMFASVCENVDAAFGEEGMLAKPVRKNIHLAHSHPFLGEACSLKTMPGSERVPCCIPEPELGTLHATQCAHGGQRRRGRVPAPASHWARATGFSACPRKELPNEAHFSFNQRTRRQISKRHLVLRTRKYHAKHFKLD